MRKFWLLILGVLLVGSVIANDAMIKCVEGNGVYIPDKGCLIEHRAVCDKIIPDLNDNVTYGWANTIPTFADGYVELGEYNVSGVIYTAKIDNSCRKLSDKEIVKQDLVKLLDRVFKKRGTFIHYGAESFDWAYITKDGRIIAFLKPSEGGFLEYIVVNPEDYNLSVSQNNDKLLIYKKVTK